MAKLNEFISQVKTVGLSRTNRFSVMMNPPPAIQYSNVPNAYTQQFGDLRKILLFCDQVQLPGLNYSTIQNRTFGEFREVPYEKLFGDLNLQFYVDTDLYVKSFFDAWMASIQDPIKRTFSYYNSYITDMTINVEDLEDEKRYAVTLYECYPKTIAPIQMDYANKDVMKLQVTMQYKYWIPESLNVRGTGTNPFVDGRRNFNVPELFLNAFGSFQQEFSNQINAGVNDFIGGLFD